LLISSWDIGVADDNRIVAVQNVPLRLTVDAKRVPEQRLIQISRRTAENLTIVLSEKPFVIRRTMNTAIGFEHVNLLTVKAASSFDERGVTSGLASG